MAWTLWRGWIAGAARRRVVGLVLVALAAGLGGGFSILAVVGAQRADTSWTRLRDATRAQDVLIGVPSVDEATRIADEFAALDDVRSVATINVGGVYAEAGSGKTVVAQFLLGLDDRFGDQIYRPVVVDGRRPRSGDEMLANRAFLDRSGLSVGDSVDVQLADGPESATPATATVTIVGEQRGPVDETFTSGVPLLIAHTGLWDRWAPTITQIPDSTYAVMARLDPGIDADEFLRRPQADELTADALEVVTADTQESLIRDAIRVQAGAFLLIGIVSALVAGAGVALLITVEVRVLLIEHRTARALGADTRSTSLAATIPFVGVGIGAAVLAVGVAVAASPWVPTGLPRRLEPSPGPWLVPATAIIGAVTVIVVCATTAFVAAQLVLRRRRPVPRRRGIATSIAGWFDRPAIGVGIAAAGGGYNRSAPGPGRATVVAASIATLLVTAAAVVHQSEYQVTARPELAGYPFDIEVGGFDPEGWPDTIAVLEGSDDVGALTITEVGSVSVDGRIRQTAGYRAIRGAPLFTLLDGRLPTSSDEVAVGARSNLTIGSTHRIDSPSPRSVTVVGRVILNLGDGADGAELLAGLDLFESVGGEASSRTALVKLSDPAATRASRAELDDVIHARTDTPFVCGEDVEQRFLPALAADPPDDEPCLPVVGPEVFNAIDLLPLTRAMTVFLAVVGAAVTAQGLVMLGRRRRREVAVLRALGFDRRQVLSSSVWLGLTVAVAATVVGVGLGLVLGRVSASWVADATGVLAPTELPWTTLGTVGLGVVVLCLVGSLPTGFAALRRTTGEELRTE